MPRLKLTKSNGFPLHIPTGAVFRAESVGPDAPLLDAEKACASVVHYRLGGRIKSARLSTPYAEVSAAMPQTWPEVTVWRTAEEHEPDATRFDPALVTSIEGFDPTLPENNGAASVVTLQVDQVVQNFVSFDTAEEIAAAVENKSVPPTLAPAAVAKPKRKPAH